MITGKGIKETEKLETRGGVDQGVDAGQWIAVFGTSLIEICKVHAHPPLLIGFGYYDTLASQVAN